MPLTILVVEDHAVNREMICLRLRRVGYRVNEARDGAQAVAMVQQDPPDIIIMDLSMPVMDGVEAWRMIKELVDAPPPVIALTAVAIRDMELTCSDLGFGAYLTKPVNFSALRAAIQSLTGAERAIAV
ncbi:MAG: response regulator [Terricaulis sp.]